jgi:hypothetical protein
MTPENTDEEIREIALSLCTEHQNALLVSAFQSKRLESSEELQAKQKSIDTLQSELEKTQMTLKSALTEIEDLKKPKEPDQSQKSSSESQKITDELRKELEEAQTKLKLAQTEIEDYKKQKESGGFLSQPKRIYPYYSPLLGGFGMLSQMHARNRLAQQSTQPTKISSEPNESDFDFEPSM